MDKKYYKTLCVGKNSYMKQYKLRYIYWIKSTIKKTGRTCLDSDKICPVKGEVLTEADTLSHQIIVSGQTNKMFDDYEPSDLWGWDGHLTPVPGFGFFPGRVNHELDAMTKVVDVVLM